MSYVKHKIKTSTGLEQAKSMREKVTPFSLRTSLSLQRKKKKYLKDSAYVTEDKFKLHPELLKDLLNLLLYIALPKMGHADPSQALALARWATQALLVCLYQQES